MQMVLKNLAAADGTFHNFLVPLQQQIIAYWKRKGCNHIVDIHFHA